MARLRGTHAVANADTTGSNPRHFAVAGNYFYYTSGARLYRSDGTPDGTLRVPTGVYGVDETLPLVIQGTRVFFDLTFGGSWFIDETALAKHALPNLPSSTYEIIGATDNAAYYWFGAVEPELGKIDTRVGSVSGYVFDDANVNSSKDTGEAGVGAARIYVDLNADGVREKNEPSTWTSSKGTYRIDDVPAGKRWLRMEHLNGYAATTSANYRVDVPALSGAVKKFGLTPGGTIRGYVLNDLNANGVQDSGEAGLANFRVWVDLDNDGILDKNEPTAHTNSAGRYLIADLLPGNYRIRLKSKAGWASTTAKAFSFTLSAASSSTKRFGVRSV